ncbi:hypothetical protein H4R23_001122 [Coemansia sp. Cherry 401B]|nr:hypothetical protein H4R23_001122 [Coemansia sp. Cherry 401B]
MPKQTLGRKRVKAASSRRCVRCRLTGSKCDNTVPSCAKCEQANTSCMYVAAGGSGRLIGRLPQLNLIGGTSQSGAPGRTGHWTRLQSSCEFLSEAAGEVRAPESLDDFVKPSSRAALSPEVMKTARMGLLKQALQAFPKEAFEHTEPLPLPSSELLTCIGDSIARDEAGDPNSELSDHMNGSSLLAMGVLLQEYSRYLM